MRIKCGFTLSRSNGENYVLSKDNSFVLNDHGAFLFEALLDGEKTNEQLFNALVESFDISTVLALNDINVFLKTLRENGALEE